MRFKTIKILVVDTDPNILTRLSNLLLETNYRFLQITTDDDVLPQAIEQQPNLILLAPPLTKSLLLCKQLKNNIKTHHIPIIFILSQQHLTELNRIFSMGAEDYIMQPLQQKELLNRIDNQLQIHYLHQHLASQENLFATLLEQTREAILIIDEQGHIQQANKATVSYFGYDKRELINQTLELLIIEKDITLFKLEYELFTENLRHDAEKTFTSITGQHKNGATFPLELKLTLVFSSKIPLIIVAITDISQRKKSEIKLQKLNRLLHRLATMDGLTQVAHHVQFNDYLSHVWQDAIRHNQSVSLLLCDIDYLKNFNDEYGNITGDTCLREVAEAIERSARRTFDLVARYSGDQFAIVLPNTYLNGALIVAQKIQCEIKRLGIPHNKSEVADMVTLSIGVAMMKATPSKTTAHLINLTFQALQEAKQTGRNRIVSKLEA